MSEHETTLAVIGNPGYEREIKHKTYRKKLRSREAEYDRERLQRRRKVAYKIERLGARIHARAGLALYLIRYLEKPQLALRELYNIAEAYEELHEERTHLIRFLEMDLQAEEKTKND